MVHVGLSMSQRNLRKTRPSTTYNYVSKCDLKCLGRQIDTYNLVVTYELCERTTNFIFVLFQETFISYVAQSTTTIVEDERTHELLNSRVAPPVRAAPMPIPSQAPPPVPPKRSVSTPVTPSGYTSPPSRQGTSVPASPMGGTPPSGIGPPGASSTPSLPPPAVPPRVNPRTISTMGGKAFRELPSVPRPTQD